MRQREQARDRFDELVTFWLQHCPVLYRAYLRGMKGSENGTTELSVQKMNAVFQKNNEEHFEGRVTHTNRARGKKQTCDPRCRLRAPHCDTTDGHFLVSKGEPDSSLGTLNKSSLNKLWALYCAAHAFRFKALAAPRAH